MSNSLIENNSKNKEQILIDDDLPPLNEPECDFSDNFVSNLSDTNEINQTTTGTRNPNSKPNQQREGLKLSSVQNEGDLDNAYDFKIKDDEAYRQRDFGDEDAKVAFDTKLEETKDYYQRNKISGDDMGTEKQKEYELDRKVRERNQKHELVQKIEQPKKPKRQKEQEDTEVVIKKEKKEITYGSDEYPLRMVKKEGK